MLEWQIVVWCIVYVVWEVSLSSRAGVRAIRCEDVFPHGIRQRVSDGRGADVPTTVGIPIRDAVAIASNERQQCV